MASVVGLSHWGNYQFALVTYFFFPPASHSPIGGGVSLRANGASGFFVDYELFDSSWQLGALSLRKIERNKEDGRQKIGDRVYIVSGKPYSLPLTLLNCGTKW